jgi:hypothetical protein
MSDVAPRWRHRLRLVMVAASVGLVGGCATASTTPGPIGASVPPSASVAPSASAAATSGIASHLAGAERTLPPSQVPIAPGTYRWDGFVPAVSFELESGWQVGHRHPEFFDLFRGDDFPGVSFGRFDDVFTGVSAPVPASDAATVVASLSGFPGLTVSPPRPIELGGLPGQEFTLTSSVQQTPLFRGAGGDFKMDPGFETRYRILDLPDGGVLVVGVVARDCGLDEAEELAAPILASLTIGS